MKPDALIDTPLQYPGHDSITTRDFIKSQATTSPAYGYATTHWARAIQYCFEQIENLHQQNKSEEPDLGKPVGLEHGIRNPNSDGRWRCSSCTKIAHALYLPPGWFTNHDRTRTTCDECQGKEPPL